jgi:hypothetical protein
MKTHPLLYAGHFRMKIIALAIALTIPALAQDEKPDAKPAPPTDPKPVAPAEARPAELPPLPAPSPEKENSDLLKVQPGGVKPDPTRSNSAVPDVLAPARKNSGSKPGTPPKDSSTLKPPTTSAELDARIRYRQAHTRASNDAAIKALWAESRVARTDYEKRETLKAYYTALYRKMLAMDKGIATIVEERKRVALGKLSQTRIDPTDPLDEEHRQRRD